MITSISESTRLWEKTLKKIQEKINDKKAFETWFENSYIHEIRGNTIIVVVENKVAKAVLNNQFSDLIKSVINDLTEDDYVIKIVESSELSSNASSTVTLEDKSQVGTYFDDAKIDSKLTFNNFVVGDFNKEAYQAALYVAKNGGTMFNPLFIYSNSGLGKTHLLHAIGNEVINGRMPNAKILYITASDLIEEYIKFVRAEKGNYSLRDYFKGVDILLLDDIQFLADKVKTEEMLFFIYQDMISKGKRIIITSDRQPTSLKGLEDRLITRFTQGLTVEIKEPSKEACIAILKEKITENGLDISKIDENVILFLADKFSKNVRELQGALNSLIFYSLNLKQTDVITMDVAIEAIGSLKGGNAVATQLSEQKIINTVADYYNVTPSMITGKVRTGQIVLARHIAMYLIRKHLDVSLEKIGEMFGGKNHTTVMSAIDGVDKKLKTNEQLRKAIEELEQRINK